MNYQKVKALAKGKTPLNMNIEKSLKARLDDYHHRKRFKSRTAALEYLLDYVLKANPSHPDALLEQTESELINE